MERTQEEEDGYHLMYYSKMARSEMQSVVGMLTLPEAFPVCRMRDEFTATKTAITKPFNVQKLQWFPTAAGTANDYLKTTDMGLFVFRNPLRNIQAQPHSEAPELQLGLPTHVPRGG